MLARFRSERVIEIFRYYQAGVVNTLFGLGAYWLLLWLGLGPYAAQAIAHVAGMAFNYLTYSRHVFRDAGPAKARFVLSYAVNYVLSVASLALIMRLIPNPYIAGIVSTFLVSVVNYFALKFVVFRARPS
ncbi:putative flippase GtrA [Novosphingobium chloroacetimidivorans]|uniref:Putative flippase GtrA n=1 Tax=Novosphingobium chloroacetimidivorans TaxID=1428314 RepID=A0A7W7K8B6_9SPHN|nr:GtrA family protein [Novosphingobium chloroacetimidivorans]MBB4857428.1 putative flippase GtrA [Novosphingobium chloroacetimidivorans]